MHALRTYHFLQRAGLHTVDQFRGRKQDKQGKLSFLVLLMSLCL